MINRLFNCSDFYFNRRDPEFFVRPFNFALKQQLVFVADLNEQLLELEQRFGAEPCSPPVPQQRLTTVASTVDDASEACIYDDFGLVVGVELDVSWM